MNQLNNYHIELGIRLKKARIKSGHINLQKFAFDNDISRILISNWESGKGNITFKNLIKLTQAINISLEELFKDFEKTK